jgi:hypothetical protein
MGASRYRGLFRCTENFRKVALTIAICASICASSVPQTGSMTGVSLPTAVRLKNSGWWPTKGEPVREQYVGDKRCAKCHISIAATCLTTGMAHAAAPAGVSEGLQQHDRLHFQLGPFSYQILTNNSGSLLSVSDGASALSQTLIWAFGKGAIGETYVYEENGSFYEAHLSFFTSLQALGITPGQNSSIPMTLQDAAGRQMDAAEAQRCFGCHTTASSVNNRFDPRNAIPGVTCEACHGPGAKHAVGMNLSTEDTTDKQILDPGRLDPVESVDFCGACHRTWQDVVNSRGVALGVLNIRFAPYRLESSHDPHKPLVTDPLSYDPVCLRCHILSDAQETPDHPGAACPVAQAKCVTCHMPKYEPPGFHAAFTDHWIRVVGPGVSYPN